MIHNIDFVILWVDGSDEKWQKEFRKYEGASGDKREIRFRDWDNLHYIFRAFEEFTPWVNKIHFVTCGHLPKWLDIKHPKLHIVNHQDYIDKTYLPVFNSHALEMNLHQIQGLSEYFVFFNDDTFITNGISKERFFKNDLPCDSLVSNAISSSGLGHFILNNIEIINRHFDKRKSLKKNYKKWFNLSYGSGLIRNLSLIPWPRFTGFIDPHMSQPFLKSTFEEVWSKEADILKNTLSSRFRECSNVNQYLFRYWQLAEGKFYPISMKDTKYIDMSRESFKNGNVSKEIVSKKYNMICLNDSEDIQTKEEFEEAKKIVKDAFEKILPNKSSFEV